MNDQENMSGYAPLTRPTDLSMNNTTPENVGWVSDSVTQQDQNDHGKNISCIPRGWAVAQIGDVAEKTAPRIPAEDEEFIYVDIGSIDRTFKQIKEPQKLLGKDAPSRARKVINTGDVLVSLTRPNLNASVNPCWLRR